MIRPRVIPTLLLKGRGLYKTVKFADPKYVGDPINTMRIFNDKEVDEIAVLDITASREARGPDMDQIMEIVSECFMPLAYGGGITTRDQAMRLFQCGVEKVILNTAAVERPELITEIAEAAGAQAVVVAIDVKKPLIGGPKVYTHGGTRKTALDPVAWAKEAQARGAGEILLTAIDREGTMAGYDVALTRAVADAVNVPVIACGGAGGLLDFRAVLDQGHASAVAAGSLFVFQGPHRAVLISYPTRAELLSLTLES
ncbi:MAG: imidazole glycerol phosphate synthase subunit HisF [Rhodospirillales bacterium]|nr:imidazole glycerol phosphate synthase subunit HisF [Alphaproteobacteria bacterium]MCB9986250.1 imidazole glycerol phosphate synthase subunit HisF [Rhodospirillales bacterium]USO07195.1 MAG: imidazole glycerol phosphate synthase subunit HisF [Rhodospirillales bacterium]